MNVPKVKRAWRGRCLAWLPALALSAALAACGGADKPPLAHGSPGWSTDDAASTLASGEVPPQSAQAAAGEAQAAFAAASVLTPTVAIAVATTASVPVAARAERPMPRSLANGLVSYYPFDAASLLDALGASTLAPLPPAGPAPVLTQDNFAAPWQGGALSTGPDGAGRRLAYRLSVNPDLMDGDGFTLGTWLRAECGGNSLHPAALLVNKRMDAPTVPGLAIGLDAKCGLHFNLGSGEGSSDIDGLQLPPGQWTYLAVTLDRSGRSVSAHVLGPAAGEKKSMARPTDFFDRKKPGRLGAFVLNEDATGNHGARHLPSPQSSVHFNDLAVWSRSLSLEELQSLHDSARPMSVLLDDSSAGKTRQFSITPPIGPR